MSDELHGAAEVSRRARTLVAVALTALVLGGAADRGLAARERGLLQQAVDRGEQVVEASAHSQNAVAEYAGPLLTRESVPTGARAAALDTLAQDAARWEPRVRARAAQVRRQQVLPWHRGTTAARTAYALRLEAFADALDAVQREPATAPLAGPAVRSTRERAQDLLGEAGVTLRRYGET